MKFFSFLPTIFQSFTISISIFLLFCQLPTPNPSSMTPAKEIEKTYQYTKQISAIKIQMEKTYLYPNDLDNPNAYITAAVYATETLDHHILFPKTFYLNYKDTIRGNVLQEGKLTDVVIIQNPNLEDPIMDSDEVLLQLNDAFAKLSFTRDNLEDVMEVLYNQVFAKTANKVVNVSWSEIEFSASEGYVSNFLKSSLIQTRNYEELLKPQTIFSIDLPLTETKTKQKIITSLSNTSQLKQFGIQKNDEILTINGKSIRYLSLRKIYPMFNGKLGESVKLKIKRNLNQTFLVEIPFLESKPNENTKLVSGKIWKGQSNILQIKVNGFTKGIEKTATDLIKETYLVAMADAKQKDIPIQGIILDLRDNTGGYLDLIIECMRMFIPKGLLVTTKIGKRAPNEIYGNGSSITDLPLVVLINENTGSGSELIAGTVRLQKRGFIFGSKSTGQGIVHSMQKLNGYDSIILKITTSYLYLPNGKIFYGNGIEPDIWISDEANVKMKFPESFPSQLTNISKEGKNEISSIAPLDSTKLSLWVETYGTAKQTIQKESKQGLTPDYQLLHSLDVFDGILANQTK
ncbi:peptidase S41 [Leptospira levettii]|uniref:S41 family peptidase n=1 Tax=Leptospira levettii TaxID=2023178 RepID=UPI0010824FE1|nr:S41 family peptidase [Leptospira levettii]TGM40509.1 peptidase S41 [Leptospira levettii]